MGVLDKLSAMKSGFSQCWLLSETCEINWDAWAAFGTLAAVVVALRIANKDKLRRWDEADARMAVAFSRVVTPMRQWVDSFQPYAQRLYKPDLAVAVEVYKADVMRCPPAVIVGLGDMRDFGPATEPLVDALLRASEAVALHHEIFALERDPELVKTLRGEEILANYTWCVTSAERAATAALGLMTIRLNRVTDETTWKTRYNDDVVRRYKKLGISLGESPLKGYLPGWLFRRLHRYAKWYVEVRPFRGK